jgi:hypothetical protein
MNAATLLTQLSKLGISVTTVGDALDVSPKSKLTPELVAALRNHKQALLSLLEPSRADGDDGCPSHWLHIPVLPPKGQQAFTQGEDGQGLRYRVKLFDIWYMLRFAPHISSDTIEVVCQGSKRRMFADLNEFYRWAWAEKNYRDLLYREVN